MSVSITQLTTTTNRKQKSKSWSITLQHDQIMDNMVFDMFYKRESPMGIIKHEHSVFISIVWIECSTLGLACRLNS